MKRLFLIWIFILLFPFIANSDPFLCSDPSPDTITKVEVEIAKGGITTIYTGTYIVSGSDIRLYDLAGFENGNYIFRARWAGPIGWWSDWSDPLTAVKSGKPGSFRIK